MRAIVTALTDPDEDDELARELQADAGPAADGDESDYDDDKWEPDPVDADPGARAGRGAGGGGGAERAHHQPARACADGRS